MPYLLTLILFVVLPCINNEYLCAQTTVTTPKYVADELFVKVHTYPNLLATKQNDTAYLTNYLTYIRQQYSNCKITPAFPQLNHLPRLTNIMRLQLENPAYTEIVLNYLKNKSAIEYVERVPLYCALYTPNDLHPEQWHLQQIDAATAWDIHIGSNNVTVAIVDDGVLTTHEDLADNIVAGFDVADNDNNPNPPVGASNNCFSHGTHCAGIVSAVTDNEKGIASVASHVKIMPVKTKPNTDLDINCNSLPGTIAGIEYAIAHNADVISMSFGGYAGSNAIQALFDQAHAQGIVCVAAAGNDNTNDPSFPAAYNHVISVGASNSFDQKTSFSNYGNTIDVMAPGTSIYSTLATNNAAYGTKQGTSMACPLVASLCALMLSYQPNLTPDELELCLKNGCDNINSNNPSLTGQLGAGRINAQQALACLQPEPVAQFNYTPTLPCAGQTVQFNDITSGSSVLSRNWTFEGGVPATSTAANPTVTFANNGLHSVTLSVTNVTGTNNVTQNIIVQQPTAILSGNTTIETGNSAILVLSLNGTPPFSVTYTDGVVPIVIPNITTNNYQIIVSPTNTTTYSLTAISSNNGCNGVVSSTATINVIPSGSGGGTNPIVIIDPITAVCLTAPAFNIVATPTGGVFSGNGISDVLNGTFNPVLAGIGVHTIVYNYTALDGNMYSAARSVTVLGENVHAGNNRFICPGEAIQLQAIGGSNYQWSPLTDIDQANTATPIVYPMTSTIYTVVSTDINGCISSDAVTIAVNPAPYFAAGNSDTTICHANSVVMRLTNTLPIDNYTYLWFPTNGVAEIDVPNSLVTVTESSSYSLIITGENGCQTVRNFAVRLGNPDVQIVPPTAVICNDQQITLTANGNDIAQYLWSNGNTLDVINNATAATYSVTVTDSNGCTDSANAIVSEGTTLLPRIINTVISASANTTLLRTDIEYATYQWSTGSIDNEIAVSAGTYSVTVTDQNGCSGFDTAIVVPFNQNAVALPTAFSPNNDDINDEWQIIAPTDLTVQYIVYNRWGQVVFDTYTANIPVWNGKQNGIHSEQGVYVVIAIVTYPDGKSETFRKTITLLR